MQAKYRAGLEKNTVRKHCCPLHACATMLHAFIINFFIFAAACDGERNAGFSQALQREAQRFDSVCRTQRADHYGEIEHPSP